MPEVTTSMLHVGGVTKQNRRTGTHYTYLRAKIGRRPYDCLLDTGSEATVIPASIIPASIVNIPQIKNTSHKLTAANGSDIPLLGEVTLPMQIGDYKTTIRGLVSEHVGEVMIGMDWITANKVTWDFASKQVNIGGRKFDLKSKSQENLRSRRVTLQEDTMVPARSEANLHTKIIFRSLQGLPDDKMQWSTQPAELQEGMYVSRTLIPKDRYRDVPVRVVNITREPVYLRAGQELTEGHAVTEVGPFDACRELAERENVDEDVSNINERAQDFVENLLKGIHPSVSQTIVIELRKLLMKYQDVFSKSELDFNQSIRIF